MIHDRDYELLEGQVPQAFVIAIQQRCSLSDTAFFQEFLNDTIIDFYFKMLGSARYPDILPAALANRCCFFSSLFIRLLMSEFKPTQAKNQDGTSRAHHWAKNCSDLFEKVTSQ